MAANAPTGVPKTPYVDTDDYSDALNKNAKPLNRRPRQKRDLNIKCRFCHGLGHDSDKEDGCYVMAKFTLCQQASTRTNEDEIKTNTRKYLKHIRNQQTNNKQRDNFTKKIRSLQVLHPNVDTSALITSLELLESEDESSSFSDSDSQQDE